MEQKELNLQAGKILGIKGEVVAVNIFIRPDHTCPFVDMRIKPSKLQEKKLLAVALEFAGLKEE